MKKLPAFDEVTISISTEFDLEIEQTDLSGENQSIIRIPSCLIPLFLDSIHQVVDGEGKK